MKIDENRSVVCLKSVLEKSYHHCYYQNGISSDGNLFSNQFSPKGRAGSFHMLRY